MPFILFFSIVGFDLLKTNNKISRFTYSTLLLLSIILLMSLLSDDDFKWHETETAANIVVGTITCINNRCIKFTFIIIYVAMMIKSWARHSSSPLLSIFASFDNIDKSLQSINNNRSIKKLVKSKYFVQILLLILFIGTFCCFALECFYDDKFNVGQFLHVMLVFILSVKISFYCMICASIKVRFIALHEMLRKWKKSKSDFNIIKVKNCEADDDLQHLKEISKIFDESLHIIYQTNNSFSILLTFVFGMYK